jgi:type IV secretion system protein TrbJ
MKRITAVLLVLTGSIHAQLATFDAVQEQHALQQIGADTKKLANQQLSLQQQVQMLAKLDVEILKQTAILEQAIYAAKYFDANAKRAWVSAGNMVVSNWTTPSYYGETALWGAAVNTGTAPQPAWQQAVLKMQKGLYIALDPMGYARNLSYAASVNTFDGAGPVALQTLGNARQQQIQIDGAIARLQTAAIDGTDGMNSQVQQLNLITAAQIIQLRQQQTNGTIATSLLEQQTIANKLQRDQLADRLNFTDDFQQAAVSQPVTWGNASQTIQNFRIQ